MNAIKYILITLLLMTTASAQMYLPETAGEDYYITNPDERFSAAYYDALLIQLMSDVLVTNKLKKTLSNQCATILKSNKYLEGGNTFMGAPVPVAPAVIVLVDICVHGANDKVLRKAFNAAVAHVRIGTNDRTLAAIGDVLAPNDATPIDMNNIYMRVTAVRHPNTLGRFHKMSIVYITNIRAVMKKYKI